MTRLSCLALVFVGLLSSVLAAVTPTYVAPCMPIGHLPPGCPETIGPQCPRCYNNTAPDYSGAGSPLFPSDATLKEMAMRRDQYVDIILKDFPPTMTAHTDDIYAGTAGAALNFLKMYVKSGNLTYLIHAKAYTLKALEDLPTLEKSCAEQGYVSFQWAPAGVLAVATATFSYLNDSVSAQTTLDKIGSIVVANNGTHNDFLPGRAGLLYTTRFIEANNVLDLQMPWTDDDLMAVAYSIIDHGVGAGRSWMQWTPPSNMQPGLGLTHGTAGVLHELLHWPALLANSSSRALIVATLDHLVEQQFTTGNFPEQYESATEDILVQWDHGAPGVSTALFTAGKILNDARYTASAAKAQDVNWERGLVTKGLQNCHGMSGNIFTMYIAYSLTGDDKYLYRAAKFTDFILSQPSLVDPSLMRVITPSWAQWSLWAGSFQPAVMLWTDLLTGDVSKVSMTGFEPRL